MGDKLVGRVLHNALALFQAKEQELGRLDAAAGDGDHGATMVRGLAAAVSAVDETGAPASGSAGELLVCAGEALADAAGGASGALFGALFCQCGNTLARRLASGEDSPAAVAAAVAAALEAGLAAVAKLGKTAPGDKTLLDALAPFVAQFAAAVQGGQDVAGAWTAALPAAVQGATATAGMVAKRGRAARLGERSRGHIDPGAQSVVYLLQTVDAVLHKHL